MDGSYLAGEIVVLSDIFWGLGVIREEHFGRHIFVEFFFGELGLLVGFLGRRMRGTSF